MANTDLSAPRAKLTWANNQINILHTDIGLFIKRKPYRILEEGQFRKIIKLQSTEELDVTTIVHIGAILAAQRDSLDYLITAISEKNGAVENRDAAFPIAESLKDFRSNRTQKKIAWLLADEKAVIETLNPYKGGNDLLYALHWLCNKAKQRKPILIGGAFTEWGLSGQGLVNVFEVYGMVDGLEAGAPVAMLDAASGVQLNFSLDVAFREVANVRNRPVLQVLEEFSRTAKAIIDLFA